MFYDLAKPFEELDAEVERELLTLAMTLARQIVRRELKTDPTQIIGIVREAIAALPVAARDVRVHLHPEDAAVVRQNLAPTESERAWQLVEDPVMARGGCQITTATSRVDARLETRLGAILSELMGTERHGTSSARERRVSASNAARGSASKRWAEALAAGARAHGERIGIRGRGHAQPDGRHDARGRRLRGRRGRPLSGRHGRRQADRGGSGRLLGRQAVSHADRRYPRHHAGRAGHSDAQRELGGGGRRASRPRPRRRRPPARRHGRAALHRSGVLDRRAAQSAAAACDPRAARRGRALHQFAALRGRRPAHRPVRRIGRRQVGAARHDDPLYQGGCDRGRA